MKIPVLAGLLLGAGFLHAQEPVDATKLLDKVIAAPGSYAQTCDAMSSPDDIPYHPYTYSGMSGAWFSKANEALIDANKPAMVKAIRARLLAIDFSRKAKTPPEDKHPEESEDGENFGCDPMVLNPLLLQLIVKLDATEAFPELLVVEGKLVDAIAKAKDSAKAPVPVVTGWSVHDESDNGDSPEGPKKDRRINLFQARVAQRDLVMLLADLMRKHTYTPYLSTKLEVAYAKGVKDLVKKNGLTDYKPGDLLPEKLEGMELKMDPILHLPVLDYPPVTVPYSRESRDEIRAAAQKWIGEHP